MDKDFEEHANLLFHPIFKALNPHFKCVDYTDWNKLISQIHLFFDMPNNTPTFMYTTQPGSYLQAEGAYTYIRHLLKRRKTTECPTTEDRPIHIGQNTTNSTITLYYILLSWEIIDLCQRAHFETAFTKLIDLKKKALTFRDSCDTMLVPWQHNTWYPIELYKHEIKFMQCIRPLCSSLIASAFSPGNEQQCVDYVLTSIKDVYNNVKLLNNKEWVQYILELWVVFIIQFIYTFGIDPYGALPTYRNFKLSAPERARLAAVGYYKYQYIPYANKLRKALIKPIQYTDTKGGMPNSVDFTITEDMYLTFENIKSMPTHDKDVDKCIEHIIHCIQIDLPYKQYS